MPIFLHSKIMMVDDLFVAIGSTNINRRGFFHDGEITAFAIPEELRNAPHNPARDLRMRLWGEQLGPISRSWALACSVTPLAGFELFKRTRYQGTCVIPLNERAVPAPDTERSAQDHRTVARRNRVLVLSDGLSAFVNLAELCDLTGRTLYTYFTPCANTRMYDGRTTRGCEHKGGCGGHLRRRSCFGFR